MEQKVSTFAHKTCLGRQGSYLICHMFAVCDEIRSHDEIKSCLAESVVLLTAFDKMCVQARLEILPFNTVYVLYVGVTCPLWPSGIGLKICAVVALRTEVCHFPLRSLLLLSVNL